MTATTATRIPALRRTRSARAVSCSATAARLDRELAAGTSPETSTTLAARTIQLTSMRLRLDLATITQRILAAIGEPAVVIYSRTVTDSPPRLPLQADRDRQSHRRLS